MPRLTPSQPAPLRPTPLVPIELGNGGATIWCKLEYLNPSGSTKDRIALYILSHAIRTGRLSAGDRVVEASSGSTSIALAMACAQMGLRFTAVMPEDVSRERLLMIRAYGGDIVLTSAAAGVRGTIERARQVAAECGAFEPRQFDNPLNAEAHRLGTAREIVEEIAEDRVDAVVSGVGTGGTLVGLHAGLRDAGFAVKPFAARPVSTGPREGAGNFACFAETECCSFSSRIPGVVNNLSTIYRPAELLGLVELDIAADLAIKLTRDLIARGFPVGPSSGLNYAAALEASRLLPAGAIIVTVLPDRMERYFSTELFANL
jgi:cysteine synthase A